MKANEMVKIHNGTASVGGIFIYETHITGEIVKVNAKSVRVHMAHMKRTTNGKVDFEMEMNRVATFTFWKTVENRQAGENAGKKVSFYKNNAYGIIEVVVE